MLEAMACGVPIAAFPVTGPIDVVQNGVTGVLHEDLATAARAALELDGAACRERAERSGWDQCTREFESQLAHNPTHSVAVGRRGALKQRASSP
jgi:glycosyltransferase involved in cell wall biosynthesis